MARDLMAALQRSLEPVPCPTCGGSGQAPHSNRHGNVRKSARCIRCAGKGTVPRAVAHAETETEAQGG